MKKFLAVFRNRWVVAALGLLAISLLIFFLGPLIGIGDSRPLAGLATRLVLILLIVLTWIIVQLVKQIRANRASKEMTEGILEAEAEEDTNRSAEEIATLKQHFEEAVSVLKKSRGKKGERGLYELPWYIIIGPPGSGKTTALVNSGLHFPLSERFGKEALRGVGGTRNCDWWFTDEAILLDTAGRYTTQDSHSDADRSAWMGFLDLLKRYRKRRPINGVLVAISVSDLMTLGDAERHAHALAIKERVQELDEHFGIRFPVYVMFTKCDLVAGFMEFFDDLARQEREQVWGVTFPLDDAGRSVDPELYGAEIDALLERLDTRLLERLSAERDLRRRSLIYGFPRQVASLKRTMTEFLNGVFRGSRFEDAPMLRGLYFTSGTQEGAPIDRLMGTIARTFGLDQQGLQSHTGKGRSYFIRNLLSKVVFQESEIAGTNRRLERQRAWLQRAAYAGVLVFTLLMLGGWGVSFLNNTRYMDTVTTSVAEANEMIVAIPERQRSPALVLPALNSVAAIPGGFGQRDQGTPWLHGLGLFQGEKIGVQAQEAYRRVLVNQLLPRIMLRIEQQIDQTGVPLDYTYEALKTYLRLGSDEHYDKEAIGAWVTLDWDNTIQRELSTEQMQELEGHLAALLEVQPAPLPLPLDESLVRRARQRLARVPLEERVYARLKYADLGIKLRDFTIREAGGPDSILVFTRESGKSLDDGVPGFLTKPGYRKIFTQVDNLELMRELSAEQWVLRDDVDTNVADLPALFGKVRELYLNDYADAYQDLIYDVRLAPFSSASDAARILNILSRQGDSPLYMLIDAVASETRLDEPDKADAEEGEDADDAYRKQKERLQQLLGGKVQQPTAVSRGQRYANVVEERFKNLTPMVEGSGTGGAPIQHLLDLLRELQNFMMTVANEESGTGVPQHVVDQGRSTLRKLQFEAERQRDPLIKGLLASAASSSANIAFGGVTTQIDAQWRSGPLAFCKTAILGRYPVDGQSKQDIRLEDFGRFFGYGGLMDKFFQDYLKDLVDTSRRPWRVKSTGGVQVGVTSRAIAQFERANSIKETFFRGDMTPFVGFDLTPVSMDASITQFTLTIDGQSTRYFHGPRVTESFEWPGPGGTGEVRIEMSPGGGTSMRQERGPWAWFRVLDDANIQPAATPEHFQATFELGGRSAIYELIARSAFNPFQSRALKEFQCPESLVR